MLIMINYTIPQYIWKNHIQISRRNKNDIERDIWHNFTFYRISQNFLFTNDASLFKNLLVCVSLWVVSCNCLSKSFVIIKSFADGTCCVSRKTLYNFREICCQFVFFRSVWELESIPKSENSMITSEFPTLSKFLMESGFRKIIKLLKMK